MRKEVVWAIVAGIVLGLVVAFGVWRINSSVSENKKVVEIKQTPSPSPSTSVQEFKIVLDKPLNYDVLTEDSVLVSGITKPGLWVVVSGANDDYIVQSDTSGAFSEKVELVPGVNLIKITAIDSTGNQSTAEVKVVYSSSFVQREVESPMPLTNNASDTSNIRQKAAQDIANTINKPKAYIGTVTDITDSTIELKTETSDIQQISFNTETTNVVNDLGTTSKQVKPSDIAIGDFIVAMGYVESNSVLGAQRILITEVLKLPKINILKAKVVNTTKKALSVASVLDNSESTVQPDTKTTILDLSSGESTTIKLGAITVDNVVIYITSTDEKNTTTIRSIFQIQKPQE